MRSTAADMLNVRIILTNDTSVAAEDKLFWGRGANCKRD